MAEQWYNGPSKRGLVALVGGPYPTLEAAKAALMDDQDIAEAKARGINFWTPWEAVCLREGQHVTLRDVLAGSPGRPTLIARSE